MDDELHAPTTLTSGKEPPGTHWRGGWVGPRVGMDAVVKIKKSLYSSFRELSLVVVVVKIQVEVF
jgi:hypothetical protein